jgi:hypothetical protein
MIIISDVSIYEYYLFIFGFLLLYLLQFDNITFVCKHCATPLIHPNVREMEYITFIYKVSGMGARAVYCGFAQVSNV